MGKKNNTLHHYFSDSERVADFYNAIVFGGREVISPCELSTADTKAIRTRPKKPGKMGYEYAEKAGDLVWVWKNKVKLSMLCIEMQSGIHYTMPIRMMGYETDRYESECREIRWLHREVFDLRGDEYLSGFAKEDKVPPVISLVLYLGDKNWDAAVDLFGMLNLDSFTKEDRACILPFLNNHRINLVDVKKLPSSEIFRTDLREVFGVLMRQNDKEKMGSFLAQNERLQHLRSDAYDVIAVFSGMKVLEQIKERCGEKEEYDMCKAMRELMEEMEQEAVKRGLEKGLEQGLEQGMEKGLEQGRQQGIQMQGERLNRLIEQLLTDGRSEELLKSVKDNQLQSRLMSEYGI